MNIEKIKNFSKEEQKALEYFEFLRNVIVERDSEELDEGIDLVVGRKFASNIELLLNLVITLEEDKEELKNSKITYEKVRDIQEKNKNIVDKNYISKQIIKDKIEEVKEFSENAISSVGHQLTIEILQELLEGDN